MLNYRFLAVIKVSRSTEVGWSGRMRSNQGLCGEGGWSKKREGSKQELLNAQLHVYKRQWVKSEREDVEGAGGGGLKMTSWGQEEENRGRQVRMKRVEGEADTELAPGGTRGGWRAGGIEREDHIHTFSSVSYSAVLSSRIPSQLHWIWSVRSSASVTLGDTVSQLHDDWYSYPWLNVGQKKTPVAKYCTALFCFVKRQTVLGSIVPWVDWRCVPSVFLPPCAQDMKKN